MATERTTAAARTDGVWVLLLRGRAGRPAAVLRSAMRIDIRRGRSCKGPSSGASVSAGRQLERPFAFQMSVSRETPGVAASRDRRATRASSVTNSRRVSGIRTGRTSSYLDQLVLVIWPVIKLIQLRDPIYPLLPTRHILSTSLLSPHPLLTDQWHQLEGLWDQLHDPLEMRKWKFSSHNIYWFRAFRRGLCNAVNPATSVGATRNPKDLTNWRRYVRMIVATWHNWNSKNERIILRWIKLFNKSEFI